MNQPVAGIAVGEAVSEKYPKALPLAVSTIHFVDSNERILCPKNFATRCERVAF
ncbi:hypothetical protein [Mycobacterium gordonae]|uniref:hypothetical protein n=1 Tax=Mycobacterium gordonae TaxID=1778 RepID=UPI0012E3DCE4